MASPRRDQGAVRDRDLLLQPAAHGRQRQQLPDRVDDPVDRRVRHPEQRPELAHGQVRTPVHGHQQHSIRQAQGLKPTRTPVIDEITATLRDQVHRATELGRLQSGERVDQLRARGNNTCPIDD